MNIEVCLRSLPGQLYHLGIRSKVARSTLADANESRHWRLYADYAQSLIGSARRLYADGSLEVDLAETVYAFDSTTIYLCLSVFPWAPFQRSKAAVKLHTFSRLLLRNAAGEITEILSRCPKTRAARAPR